MTVYKTCALFKNLADDGVTSHLVRTVMCAQPTCCVYSPGDYR